MCDFVSINQSQIGGRLIENELPRFWRLNVEKIECTVINASMTKPPEKVRSKNIHVALQEVSHNVTNSFLHDIVLGNDGICSILLDFASHKADGQL